MSRSASDRRRRAVPDICPAGPTHEIGCRSSRVAAERQAGADSDRRQGSSARKILSGDHRQSITAVKSHCTSAPPSIAICSEWRAGRECSSGNIFSHSVLTGARWLRSCSHTVILMMSPVVPPPASTMAFMCANMLAHCSSIRSGMAPVAGSRPRITPDIRRLPIRQAFGIGLACLKLPIWMLLRLLISKLSLLFGNHAVAERADAGGLHLDNVAGLQPARRIEPRAGAGRRAGGYHVAGLQRREGRQVGDQSVERKHQALGGILLAHLAVDACDDIVGPARIGFIRGDDPRPDAAGAVEILALGDVEFAVVQPVARAALVAQGHAEDMRPGLLARDMTALLAD